jgi:hypothetical protein
MHAGKSHDDAKLIINESFESDTQNIDSEKGASIPIYGERKRLDFSSAFSLVQVFAFATRESQLCKRAFELVINGSSRSVHTLVMLSCSLSETFFVMRVREREKERESAREKSTPGVSPCP